MSHPNRPIELLAPVGSPQALVAAVRCGANAVYLGAGSFHARQNAQPFDEEMLRQAVAYCHERGVKVHMTLNTLIREDEFPQALADAQLAASLGVDALIVQDRGLAAAIHRAAPSMVLHASTQLTCHTPQGVRQLQKEGFSRVVLAREMSREEIAACCEVGCEIETFVHGALCMSVSGQCLLSAMLGGRSGNRGRCAQPCRLPFAVDKKPQENDRALSLKDLSLYEAVQDLQSLGVCSLKIEGRMKRPEYVAAAVSVCRAALDGKPVDPVLAEDLRAVFSRSGFTDGYYAARRDKTMFGSRTKEDVTAAPAAQKRLSQLYLRERAIVPLTMQLTVSHNTPTVLLVQDEDGHTVTVTGECPRAAYGQTQPDRLQAALQKLGGTPYTAQRAEVSMEEGTDVPLSAINALRREAIERLAVARQTSTPVAFAHHASPSPTAVPMPPPSFLLRLQHASQWSKAAASCVQAVIVPLNTPKTVLCEWIKHGKVAVEIPRGMFSSEAILRRQLQQAKECGVCAAVVHNVGAIPLCIEVGLPMWGGFGLHTYNAQTLQVHADQGLSMATLSPELTAKQTAFVKNAPVTVTSIVYGRLPLMLLRNCPASAKYGCKDCKQNRTMIDRKGAVFGLVCANGCADLLNSVPLYLLDRLDTLPHRVYTLYMTTESQEEVTRLATLAAQAVQGNITSAACAMNGKFTRGIKLV